MAFIETMQLTCLSRWGILEPDELSVFIIDDNA